MSEEVIEGRQILTGCENHQGDYILTQNERNLEFVKDELIKREQLVQNKITESDFIVSDLRKQYSEAEEKALSEAQ